jgi:Crp-like helix-turn-helix domain
MTRETLARHLSSLAKQGPIVLDKDSIQVLDPERLADLVS